MPNTPVQAAGEAMPTVTLESLMDRYQSAVNAANNLPYPLQDTVEEAELLASSEAFDGVTIAPSSYQGMVQAVRLAAKEIEDFPSSTILDAAVSGIHLFVEERETELPVERVERLARELAETLPNWAGGSYMAMVYPEGDGRGYWFRHISHGASSTDALGKLRSLMDEAATILVKYPELNIERIAVNEHGVHTFLKVPGVPPRAPVDPLLATIQEFHSGLTRFNELEKETVTQADEDRLVAETYGGPIDRLYDWDAPAVTLEGAIEALKLMKQQDVFSDRLGESMARAVLSFLEGAKA
ncbi:hypothetical protein [Agrobacterium rubi]|uniref:Uncharacterized protein n=1 Tax=Agrobacterium rubi TaxID=28099 RepID=A0ABX2IYW1_9HYPH|nr:hypothetical protein [Agrobacterium rubi]NTF35528.1 hypothetical protein [Agrobacterium rubi]